MNTGGEVGGVRGDAALDEDFPEEFSVKRGLPTRGEAEWNERER